MKGDELKYVGYWESYNGSTLEIMPDGGGKGEKRNVDGNVRSSESMNGAQVLVNGSTLSLKLMGLKMDYHVDAAPAMVNSKMQMRLDGMDYVKMK